MHKTLVAFFTILISCFWGLAAQAQYSVEDIPNPKAQGQDHYVSDPDGNLSSAARAQLDAIGTNIEQANSSEFAVVVVNDYQGDSDFDFALDLFTHWGIGKQGSNNGLLLFLSMDRREYRFISGYGIEGVLPDALLKQIGESYLVPYLQAGNPDMAMLATAKAVESVLLSPEHTLEMSGLQAYAPTFWNRHAAALERSLVLLALLVASVFWMNATRKRILKKQGIKPASYKSNAFWFAFFTYLLLLLIGLFVCVFMERVEQAFQMRNLPYFLGIFGALLIMYHYLDNCQFIRKSTKDEKTGLAMQNSFTRMNLLPLLLSPFTYAAYFKLVGHSRNVRLRETPPALPGNWVRVHRDTLTQKQLANYLSALQLREEKLGSKSYEIWLDQDSSKSHLVTFPGKNGSSYSECPKCHGRTLKKPAVVVRTPATKTMEGVGERIRSCAFCDHKVSLGIVALAKLQSSSGSSSSGGGGGGGGSSSGGSFGGGSSGGGGAGGRW